jgi:Cu+-exporting ATPase
MDGMDAGGGMSGGGGSDSSMPMSHVFFETSALLIAFVMLGKYLETVAKDKTSDALSALLSLQPAEAVVALEDPEEAAWWARQQQAQAGGAGGQAGDSAAAGQVAAPVATPANSSSSGGTSLPTRTVPLALVAPGDSSRSCPAAPSPATAPWRRARPRSTSP